ASERCRCRQPSVKNMLKQSTGERQTRWIGPCEVSVDVRLVAVSLSIAPMDPKRTIARLSGRVPQRHLLRDQKDAKESFQHSLRTVIRHNPNPDPQARERDVNQSLWRKLVGETWCCLLAATPYAGP